MAAAPRLTAGAPPSSRPPTRGGYGCTSRQGTHRIKSGTSPAAEWPKRARPPDLSSLRALRRADPAGRCAPPRSPTHRCQARSCGVGVRASWGVCACVGRGVAGELLLSVSRRQRRHRPAVRSTRSHRPQLLSAARLANHHQLRRLRRVPRQRRAPSPARPRRLSIFSAGGRARLPAHSCPPSLLAPPSICPGN